MGLSKHIPSMYQRRLLLIMGGMGLLALAPAAQLTRLTLAKGPALRAQAERHLISQTWLDNVRGEIRDRKGRVLAADRPSMDIAVDYPMITGEWADAEAARKARRLSQGKWSSMSLEQRDEAIKKVVHEFDARLDRMWDTIARTGGVTREDIENRKAEIRDEVQLLATQVTERQRQERERLINRGDDPSDDEPGIEVRTADVQRPIREEARSHVILSGVPDTIGFEFERLARDTIEIDGRKPEALYPGLRVLDAKRREYPLSKVDVPVDTSVFPKPLQSSATADAGGIRNVRVEGVATHLVGWMRAKLYKEDIERRPYKKPDGTLDLGHYRPGDLAGQGGFEQAAEDELRGLRGVRTVHLDTREVETTAPTRGRDIDLTIDALLQARVQALFEPDLGLTVVQPWHKVKRPDEERPKFKELPVGTPLNGAVVILDIASGDILTMVSMPSFTSEQLLEHPDTIFKDAYAASYLNRAIDKPYPPGSIVKPLILNAAVAAGKYRTDERIACTGHFYPDKPLLYRCWIYKQFHDTHSNRLGHDLDGSEAIKASCNIFFYELGRRLGPSGIHDCFTMFGVGNDAPAWNLFGRSASAQAGAGLVHEHRGGVPAPASASSSEAVLMGIGQGPVIWTPLHAADAYATIARRGLRLSPRLRIDADQLQSDLHLSPAAITQSLDGLRRSANEDGGTTYSQNYEFPDGTKVKSRIFDAPGIDIWAKSGTADAPPFIADLDFNGAHEAFDGDHSWCVFLAGISGVPKYAIAVVVDHGGSGGRVAGPVANQVVYALMAEGYLPHATQQGTADPLIDSSRAQAAVGAPR